MPWYFPWSESIKKRACRYLLQHYLGQFLKEKLTLDQLSVDLYNGTGTIKNVQLDVAAINEALESSHIPVEVVEGFVGNITVSIPWSALVTDNTKMLMTNLEVTLQPKQRGQDTGVMFDSMLSSFSSMTTSMQLAQECLKSEDTPTTPDSSQPYEGVEMFANTIEAVLSKVKVSFVDTIIRLEHLPRAAETGAALEVRVHRMEYFDDQADSHSDSQADKPADSSDRPQFEVAAIAHKNIQLVGVSLYCEEFTANKRTGGKAEHSEDPLDSLSPRLSIGLTASIPPPQPMLRSQDSTQSVPESTPIKVALLMGRQEVKVKIKQRDDVAGPKLELEGHIGGCHIHLSPRQLHLLLEIAEGLSRPDLSTPHGPPHNKPMAPSDFLRVEEDLQRQLRSERVHIGQQGMLGTDMSELDDEEDEVLLSLGSTRAGSSSIMETSYSTVKSTNTSGSYNPVVGFRKRETPAGAAKHQPSRSQVPKEPAHKVTDDPSADLTKYSLKVSFLSLMLLHEDPRSRPEDICNQGECSTSSLSAQADKYFGRVHGVTVSGTGSDLLPVREQFSAVCPHDHISLLCKPVSVAGSQKASAATYSVSVELSVGQMEVVEALYDRSSPTHAFLSLQREEVVPEYCELLVFDPDPDHVTQPPAMYSSLQHSAAPSVRIRVQCIDSKKKTRRHSTVPDKTDIVCELGRCHTEVDMTLVDRISEVLTPQPLARHTARHPPTQSADPSVYQSAAQTLFTQTLEDEHQNRSERKTEVKVTSSQATILLRFPRPDLRGPAEHDQQWWKKNLHRELLIVELQQMELHSVFWAEQPLQRFEVTCREAHGLFQDSADVPPRSFMRISTAENPVNDKEEGFDWPRFVVTLIPEHRSDLSPLHLEDLGLDESVGGHDSLNGACSDLHQPECSPFSCSRVMYDNTEMVIPGNRQEMLEFEEKASSKTRMLLELSVPHLNACLPDRDFLELVYNRVLNDLILWEPLAPSPLETENPVFASQGPWTLNLATQMAQEGGLESFRMCKSGLYNDSSSESEESSDFFPSVNEQRQKSRRRQQGDRASRQSRMCLSVNIGRGRLTACTGVKGADSPDHGEFVLDVDEGILFVSASHAGNPDLQYVCVHANKAALYHNGCVETVPPLIVPRADFAPPPALHPTIYLSDRALDTRLSGQVGEGGDSGGHDMLSVAVRIELDSKQNNKFITVGLGVRGATLRHKSTPSGQNWIQQLLELFDMEEFPVLGYTPPKVLTELHLHVWSSAIDYRPLYLPYCAVLVLESFSISSNVLADSPTSLLRFLFEDAALYLSDRNRPDPSDLGVNLEKDYVCVADVGILELCLRTSDGKNAKYPKLDLQLTNNILHLRTCSDSAQALAKLIVYLASDPDLEQTEREEEGGTEPPTTTPTVHPPELPSTDTSHLDQVHDLMSDAMRESASSHSSQDGLSTPDRSASPEVLMQTQAPPTRVYVSEAAGGPRAGERRSDRRQTCGRGSESGAGGVMRFSTLQEQEDQQEAELPVKNKKQKGRHKAPPPSQTAPPCGETENYSSDEFELNLTESEVRQVTMEMSLSLSEQREMEEASQEEPSLPANQRSRLSATPHSSGEEEFCVIDDPGLGIAPRDGEPLVRFLHPTPIQLVDNHFSPPLGKSDVLKAPESYPGAVYRYTLQELSLVWYMYGGKDFESSPASKTTTKTSKALEHNRFGRVGKQGGLVMRRARGGQGRDLDVLMELQLSKVRVQYDIYPDHTEQASRQILVISDIEMRDRLASSKINKFLYQYSSDSVPRQSHTHMLLVKALHTRPETQQPTNQECSLRLSIQPLRFNIDQDALYFLMMYFSELGGPPSPPPPEVDAPPPVMKLGETIAPDAEEKISPEELHVKFDEMRAKESQASTQEVLTGEGRGENTPVFIKCFVFSPDVPIRLDYHGRYGHDMGQGTWANLVVGLAQLNCSELRLKRLYYKKGLLGSDKLARYCRDEWLRDIMKNQLPSILGGVGPLHSLVQLVQGVRNLFWMPVEQYQRDGRIVRGIQKGTQSFVTCTAMSTLELTNKLVQTVQYVAEVGHEMVSPLPSMRRRKPPRYRLKQPADIREGVVNAYTVITEGLKGTADHLYQEAVDGAENKGLTGAVGGVLRQVPPTVIKPIILTTEATSNILGGMRNQLLPDKRREEEDKWRPEDQ